MAAFITQTIDHLTLHIIGSFLSAVDMLRLTATNASLCAMRPSGRGRDIGEVLRAFPDAWLTLTTCDGVWKTRTYCSGIQSVRYLDGPTMSLQKICKRGRSLAPPPMNNQLAPDAALRLPWSFAACHGTRSIDGNYDSGIADMFLIPDSAVYDIQYTGSHIPRCNGVYVVGSMNGSMELRFTETANSDDITGIKTIRILNFTPTHQLLAGPAPLHATLITLSMETSSMLPTPEIHITNGWMTYAINLTDSFPDERR